MKQLTLTLATLLILLTVGCKKEETPIPMTTTPSTVNNNVDGYKEVTFRWVIGTYSTTPVTINPNSYIHLGSVNPSAYGLDIDFFRRFGHDDTGQHLDLGVSECPPMSNPLIVDTTFTVHRSEIGEHIYTNTTNVNGDQYGNFGDISYIEDDKPWNWVETSTQIIVTDSIVL